MTCTTRNGIGVRRQRTSLQRSASCGAGARVRRGRRRDPGRASRRARRTRRRVRRSGGRPSRRAHAAVRHEGATPGRGAAAAVAVAHGRRVGRGRGDLGVVVVTAVTRTMTRRARRSRQAATGAAARCPPWTTSGSSSKATCRARWSRGPCLSSASYLTGTGRGIRTCTRSRSHAHVATLATGARSLIGLRIHR